MSTDQTEASYQPKRVTKGATSGALAAGRVPAFVWQCRCGHQTHYIYEHKVCCSNCHTSQFIPMPAQEDQPDPNGY